MMCKKSDMRYISRFLTELLFNIHRLYWITKNAGEREGSELMKVNAWHHRADAVASVVALVGVGKNFHTMSIFLSIWRSFGSYSFLVSD